MCIRDRYQEGGWGTDYIPHVLADGQTVAANVSVNKMTFLHRGKRRQWIQLGTVMTHPDYRGNGLGRFLMEKILSEYKNSEAVYLFANDTVLDYYPKFGFQPSREFHCTFPLPELPVPLASVRKLIFLTRGTGLCCWTIIRKEIRIQSFP